MPFSQTSEIALMSGRVTRPVAGFAFGLDGYLTILRHLAQISNVDRSIEIEIWANWDNFTRI